MKKNLPIRMCVTCRKRELQKNLLRLQNNNGVVCRYTGQGRSFYLCKECIVSDKHIINKVCGRLKLEKQSLEEILKEFKHNVSN
jgi:predicted RNA-binding protein YlxR (DUF448 family)